MKKRSFGDAGVSLPLLGVGCGRVGSLGNATPIAVIRQTLERALELRANLFDTADIYGQGDSEREIGRLLKGRRDRGFVVTKVGKRFSLKMRLMRPMKPLLRPLLGQRNTGAVVSMRGRNMASNYEPGYVEQALNASLRRLRTDHVDALLLHSPPAELVTPELGERLAQMKASGKARHVGVACDDMATLEASLELLTLDLLELPVDLIDAAQENGVMEKVMSRRTGVLAREVLRLQPGLSPAAAIAGAAGRPGVTTVIVGASRMAHLDQAAAALAAL